VTPYECEVGPHSPALQQRFLENPVASWAGMFLTRDTRHPVPEMHLDFYDLVSNTHRCVVKAPRSYAKTTVICKNFVLYLACNYKELLSMENPPVTPRHRVKILSYSGSKAEEIAGDIKAELEDNDLIKAVYGDLKGQRNWGVRRFKTADGFEVSCSGRGAQVRGFRPDLLICDDLDDDEEVESDERMEKAFRWWDSAVYNTIDEDDYQVFVIGTTLHDISLLNHIAGQHSFEVHTYKAYRDGVEAKGREVWPSKWPHEKLQTRKMDIGERSFYQEFMNEPQPSENPIFERDWFREYDPGSEEFRSLMSRGMYTVECVDLASSKQDKADYTAIVTASATFEKYPRVYLRTGGVNRDHWDVIAARDTMIRVYFDLDVAELGIETVAYQGVMAQLVKDWEAQNRLKVRVKAMIPDTDKERRARSVQHIVSQGRLYIDPNDPMQVRTREEMVLFQPGRTNIKKDLMDACVYCLMMINQWAQRTSGTNKAKRVLPKGAHIKEHTGVV